MKRAGYTGAVVIHPEARVFRDTLIGEGSILCPGVFIRSLARVGRNFHAALGVSVGHDSVIGDHVRIGADILFKEGLIDSFQIDTFPREYYGICEDSIRLHNKLSLPSGLSGEGRLFADIIRDADKVDIFRMVVSILSTL